MVLHDRLRGIHMLEDESVTSFLGRYTQIRDEFAAVGEVVNPNSLVRQAMNSFQIVRSICTGHYCQGGHAYMGEDVG